MWREESLIIIEISISAFMVPCNKIICLENKWSGVIFSAIVVHGIVP